MKVIRRIPTLTVFGAGFLLGSRSGPGAWEKATAKFNDLQGKTGMDMSNMNTGQVKEKIQEVKGQVKEAVGGMQESMQKGNGNGGMSTTGADEPAMTGTRGGNVTGSRGGDVKDGLTEM